MLDVLGQVTTTYQTADDQGVVAAAMAFLMAWLIIIIPLAILTVVGLWKIFEKAGVEGWKSIIPIYNMWCLAEIAGKPGWWALLSLIPYVGAIAGLVVSIIVNLELAKAFGKETGFAVLMILLPFVGYPMLGFSDAKYTKPKAA
jgi:hypothetical protein